MWQLLETLLAVFANLYYYSYQYFAQSVIFFLILLLFVSVFGKRRLFAVIRTNEEASNKIYDGLRFWAVPQEELTELDQEYAHFIKLTAGICALVASVSLILFITLTIAFMLKGHTAYHYMSGEIGLIEGRAQIMDALFKLILFTYLLTIPMTLLKFFERQYKRELNAYSEVVLDILYMRQKMVGQTSKTAQGEAASNIRILTLFLVYIELLVTDTNFTNVEGKKNNWAARLLSKVLMPRYHKRASLRIVIEEALKEGIVFKSDLKNPLLRETMFKLNIPFSRKEYSRLQHKLSQS